MGCPRLDDVLVALCKLLGRSSGEVQLSTGPGDGCVLVGLELGIVVREFVVEDGNGHAVEDDAKGDAGEGKDTAQVGFWENVAVTHRGNTHLKDSRDTDENNTLNHAEAHKITWVSMGALLLSSQPLLRKRRAITF